MVIHVVLCSNTICKFTVKVPDLKLNLCLMILDKRWPWELCTAVEGLWRLVRHLYCLAEDRRGTPAWDWTQTETPTQTRPTRQTKGRSYFTCEIRHILKIRLKARISFLCIPFIHAIEVIIISLSKIKRLAFKHVKVPAMYLEHKWRKPRSINVLSVANPSGMFGRVLQF